ncbi:hypothetical protein BJV82DRAFT_661139 [Fennellomyces sp. T-0311]|nr:hypothetical protein BJV82DRAFT_661139 [Fennellomyces sp. T-0311]
MDHEQLLALLSSPIIVTEISEELRNLLEELRAHAIEELLVARILRNRMTLTKRLSQVVYSDPYFASALAESHNTGRKALLVRLFVERAIDVVILQENHPFHTRLRRELLRERLVWELCQKSRNNDM